MRNDVCKIDKVLISTMSKLIQEVPEAGINNSMMIDAIDDEMQCFRDNYASNSTQLLQTANKMQVNEAETLEKVSDFNKALDTDDKTA